MPIPAILATVGGALVSGLVSKALGTSTSTSASTTAQATSSTQTLGKDDFLRLMVAQLKNQDPLNPMNNTEFVAQTAQFTSLEQLQNINTTLEKLAGQSNTGGIAGASALLGKTVTVNGSPLALGSTGTATLAYALPTGAAAVAVRVFDQSGNAVRTMVVGQQGAGTHQLVFDGLDDNGKRLGAGSYTYQVVAANANGQSVPGVYTGAGQVTGINVEGNTLMLVVGNQRVPLTAVAGVLNGGTV
jgi:flagellar basal-body rod modification protein FlgD